MIEAMQEDWGTGVGLTIYAPSVRDDPRTRAWWARYQRLAATPGEVAATLRMQLDVDVRHLLPSISVPSLVIHRRDDMLVPVTLGRVLARSIAGARYLELDGTDHMYWVGDQSETLQAIRAFVAELAEDVTMRAWRSRRSRRPETGWESLTPAELTVVQLIAAGLTNREIAQRLFVSPRTVQTHVAHAMRKLQMSRRSQIAAEASRRLA
jgi:DNA-binding CsgD family transcriptional regulator